MLDPGHLVEETVTVEEDPQEMIPVVSVETSEDGTTRRTETTVSLFFMQSHVHISYVVFKYTVNHFWWYLNFLRHFILRKFYINKL